MICMNKADRRSYVERRAREMAQSGQFPDYQAIEHALVYDEGYSEARGWLDNATVRTHLDMLCDNARKGSNT